MDFPFYKFHYQIDAKRDFASNFDLQVEIRDRQCTSKILRDILNHNRRTDWHFQEILQQLSIVCRKWNCKSSCSVSYSSNWSVKHIFKKLGHFTVPKRKSTRHLGRCFYYLASILFQNSTFRKRKYTNKPNFSQKFVFEHLHLNLWWPQKY